MDRFSEQIIKKQSTGKDMFIRGLYIAAAIAVLAVVFLFVPSILIWITALAAVTWGTVWLLQGTFTEYEYIVTNDDLDIDKIIGKRKRKRLITLSLRSVKSLEQYSTEDTIDADVAVMAHDETGNGMYLLVCDSKEYGELAVVFNPDRRTLATMIGGFDPKVKNKYAELYESVKEDDDHEESTEAATEETPAGSGGNSEDTLD